MASTWPLPRNWQSAEQRHLCWERSETAAAAWEQERAKIEAAANEARSEAAQRRPRNEDGTLASPTTNSGTTGRTGHQKGEIAKATLAGTNRGAVQRVAKMRRLAGTT